MGYGADWPACRAVAVIRDLSRCVVCGQAWDDGHHRVVQGMGGRKYDDDRHSPEKLITVCRGCHGMVHRNPVVAKDLGYFVPTGSNPAESPVWYAAEKCWFTLTLGGTRIYQQMSKPEVLL
jgi:hypothetical protein